MQSDSDASHLWELIRDIKYGMFTARHGNGQLRSRPMTTLLSRHGEHDGVLWFFMSRSAEPALDIEAAPSANVSYADPGRDAYVSVSGRARIVDDPAMKRALWTPLAHAWYPGGPTDPDLALVAVSIDQAEYWDVKTNKAVKLFEMAKAAVTGAPPSFGEHRKVRLH
jgi:general stress protein 26